MDVTILKYLAESNSDVLLNRDVASISLRNPSSSRNLAYYRLGGALINIEDVDTRSGQSKCFCNRSSNATTGTSHDSNFMDETLRVASSVQMNNLRGQTVS